MDPPILLVVDEDQGVLDALSGDLGRRFAADYRIVTEPSPASALTVLERLAAASQPVALIVAGQQMTGKQGAGGPSVRPVGPAKDGGGLDQ
jgi:thioredoxin reductase (NADPH)